MALENSLASGGVKFWMMERSLFTERSNHSQVIPSIFNPNRSVPYSFAPVNVAPDKSVPGHSTFINFAWVKLALNESTLLWPTLIVELGTVSREQAKI